MSKFGGKHLGKKFSANVYMKQNFINMKQNFIRRQEKN